MTPFYGQFNPPVDQIIKEYFPTQTAGFCIEVGAVDGINCSNTMHFEKLGWDCLCIEPNPEFFQKLRDNRKTVIWGACDDVENPCAIFHAIDIGWNNWTAASALVVDPHIEAMCSVEHRIDYFVPVYTLDKCINMLPKRPEKIDFVSIDTEGNEMNVLHGFSIQKWMPKLFVIENNFDYNNLRTYMSSFGYVLDKRYEANDFYVKEHK